MTVRVAIIGCGNWGINHVRSARRLKNATLSVVCDASEDARARALETAPLARGVASPEEVWKDPEIDAVIIASPAPSHASLAGEALSAGKHVLVEKPFVLDPADGERLVQQADETGRTLMVGHLLRYHPYFVRLENLAKTGDLGKLHYVYSERVNLGVVRADENAFWSLAPHDVSMMCALMDDEPVEVACTGQSFLRPGVEDVVFATIKFANGTIGHVHVSWLDPHKHRKLTVVGSKKMAVFDDMEPNEKLRIYDKGVTTKEDERVSFDDFLTLRNGDISIPSIRMAEPLNAEQQHFIDCIRARKTPTTDGREALRVMRIMLGATESLKNGGRPVAL
jgi:predicted dehydrogenase